MCPLGRRHRSGATSSVTQVLVGCVALLVTTALVVGAVIVATGAGLIGAPPPQQVASDDFLRSLAMEMLEAESTRPRPSSSVRRGGNSLEVVSFQPGELVWWVHVRGQFRYVGRTPSQSCQRRGYPSTRQASGTSSIVLERASS